MRNSVLFAACVVSLAHAGVVAEVLQPTDKWRVDYGDKKCIMGRAFGSGKDSVTLIGEQYAPGDNFRLNLIGQRFKGWSELRHTKIRFGPDQGWQDLEFFSGSYGKDVPAILSRKSVRIVPWTLEQIEDFRKNESLEVLAVTDAQKAAVQTVDIKRGGKQLQLSTGRFDRVSAEMNKCLGAMVKSWGFDPEVMARLKSGPKPLSPPSKWIVSRDYPVTAVKRGQRALVSVRLNVDMTGAVVACEILHSTRPKEFEDAVCRALQKRARFEPAIGPDGKAIAAYWNSDVVFTMGG